MSASFKVTGRYYQATCVTSSISIEHAGARAHNDETGITRRLHEYADVTCFSVSVKTTCLLIIVIVRKKRATNCY